MMIVKAAAKINLMLDILEKLDNGYHSLFMIMQSVGIYDTVTVNQTSDGGISLSCSNKNLPTGQSNIAFKAAMAFFDESKCENSGIHIDIQKRIPMEAGLAGGSADAAAVILALDKIYNTHMPLKKLCKIGQKVGADVPFCIQGGTMLALDVGGVLAQLPDLPQCYIVLAKPSQGVSTAKAYAMYDEVDSCHHLDTNAMLRTMVNGDLRDICSMMGNVFEQFIEVSERVKIKNIMRENNSIGHCMSGSGPTVFGIFENERDALNCEGQLKKTMDDVFVCRPVSQGCEFE
ncbi:MAG: 4-(cytidine 5'-diphospho)-2-C-methyl-D-erythritol kinase [Oscillospiraceae bacterium]|jgi:4-diphosphocytidyl-2-C-methyl-D-erythritol kinase|nr:4-(cytidine 5'-diphospho)-2-C-methyl-D-erythritol kinase [Oscillospiraceae bacterium]